MNPDAKKWLIAAGVVSIGVVAVVLAFGLRFPPDVPSLYRDGGPTIVGRVAYVDYDHHECVFVLDVATGDAEEVYCDDWLWLEGWDLEGNLRIQSAGGHERVLVVDPVNGEVVAIGDLAGEPPAFTTELRATSDRGRATLVYGSGEAAVTLIDLEGSRNYGFWEFGLSEDGSYAWVCDSEDRLLVVAADGSGGPWLVAEGIHDPAWN